MRIESFKLAWTARQPKDDDRFRAWVFAFLGFEREQLAERSQPGEAGHACHFEKRAAGEVLGPAAGAIAGITRFHKNLHYIVGADVRRLHSVAAKERDRLEPPYVGSYNM